MKLICAKCGEPFRVGREQLGKRGKCPSCKATISIPRSRAAVSTAHDPIEPPSRFVEHVFAIFVGLAAHLVVIALLAMVPWNLARRGLGGDGVEIALGQLARAPTVATTAESFSASEPSELSRLAIDELPDPAASLSPDGLFAAPTAPELDLMAGARTGGSPPELAGLPSTQLPGGGEPHFELFVSQLRQDGLDIAICFDSTGSMQGEIDQVKAQIERIGRVLQRLVPAVRISLCTYRDHGDEYVVKGLPLTEELGDVVGFLSEVRAAGGGDEPEAVDEGLRWVLEHNEFRESARKVILLFGDAPPRYEQQTECLRLAAEFRRAGGVISTVTCRQERRLVPLAEIAQLGGGEAFLTRDNREIMAQLVVLVFGSQYRQRVLDLFELEGE